MELNEAIKSIDGLVWKLAHKYSYTIQDQCYSIEDLHAEGVMAFCSSYPRYDKFKGSLTTFAYAVVRNKMIKVATEAAKVPRATSYDVEMDNGMSFHEILPADTDMESEVESEIESESRLGEVMENLSETAYTVVKVLLESDMVWEIPDIELPSTIDSILNSIGLSANRVRLLKREVRMALRNLRLRRYDFNE